MKGIKGFLMNRVLSGLEGMSREDVKEKIKGYLRDETIIEIIASELADSLPANIKELKNADF